MSVSNETLAIVAAMRDRPDREIANRLGVTERTVQRYRKRIRARRAPYWRHGLVGSYVTYGCRCEECTEANRVRQKRLRKNRAGTLAPDDPRHGRYTTYSNWSCRCAECSRAWSAYNKEKRPR